MPVGQGNSAQSVPKQVCQGLLQNCIKIFDWFKMIEGGFWIPSYIFHDEQQLCRWDKNGKQNTSERFPFLHNLWVLMIIQPSLHLEGLIICPCTYWQLCSFGQICRDRFTGRVFPLPFFRSLLVSRPAQRAGDISGAPLQLVHLWATFAGFVSALCGTPWQTSFNKKCSNMSELFTSQWSLPQEQCTSQGFWNLAK